MTGFTLPPEVTSEKRRLADGWAYVFRHRRLGMLGRLLLQDLPNGQSHLRCEVAGDPADPMTAERGRILKPIGLALSARLEAALGSVAGVPLPLIPPASPRDPGQWVATRVMICPRCDAPTSAIYDVPRAAEPAQFEDQARLLYTDCAQRAVPAWIIGAEDSALPGSPARIMAIWPRRGPIEAILPEPFNARIAEISETHCTSRPSGPPGRPRKARK